MNTIYWCKIFKAPNLRRKHHVIGYEPILGVNHTSLVHHMLLHECVLDANEDMKKWEKYVTEDGRACYSDTPLEWEKCLQPIVAWAVGSEGKHITISFIKQRKNGKMKLVYSNISHFAFFFCVLYKVDRNKIEKSKIAFSFVYLQVKTIQNTLEFQYLNIRIPFIN